MCDQSVQGIDPLEAERELMIPAPDGLPVQCEFLLVPLQVLAYLINICGMKGRAKMLHVNVLSV